MATMFMRKRLSVTLRYSAEWPVLLITDISAAVTRPEFSVRRLDTASSVSAAITVAGRTFAASYYFLGRHYVDKPVFARQNYGRK
jgi:hypothetical protein